MKILHVGMPKSGTTYLQRNLFSKLGTRRDFFVAFPKRKGSKRVWAALQEIIADDPGKNALWLKERLEKSENWVISFEGLTFSPNVPEQHFSRLADFFGSDALLLVTLRFEREFISSKYQQAVKADLAVSQREFFYPESEVVSGALRNFPIDSWSPDQIVLSCQRYFSRVLVIPSNSFELPYLERLLDLTEMFQISDAGAISGSERRRNTSLSAGQVRAIENVNLALREAIRIAAAVFPARLSELLVRSLLYLKAASLNVLTRRDGTANRLALIPEVEMSWKLISRSNPICRGIWGSASHREFNR